MEPSLKGINILIIGGDKRELELFFHLQKTGAKVCMYGFNEREPFSAGSLAVDLAEELSRAHVIITPLNGIEADGAIYTPYFDGQVNVRDLIVLRKLKAGTLFLAGYIHRDVKQLLKQNNIVVLETSGLDEISILNAVPTGEGAIQVAMQETAITIHNSQCFVLGYGRCGRILAEMLKGLNANVTVVARRKEMLAWVKASGMNSLLLDHLGEQIFKAEIIFNTIPSIIIDGKMLCHVKKDVLIIDLASYPGGIDFDAARRIGIHTLVLPGLPGKVAPKTAGRILCQVYPSLIVSALKGGENFELKGN